jgi:hypothetical protein
MYSFLLAIFIFINSASLAFADNAAMAAVVPPVVHTILGGTVRSVSWANPSKGTKSEIVVIDAAKKKATILITPTTTLWDANAKAVLPEKIVVKKKVNIVYLTTEEGVNVAKSIKILK